MNVNSMYQLMGAIQKNPQVVGEAVANGAGVGFEDMLQQAGQKPANTAADKKPAQANDNKPANTANKETQNTQGSQSSQDTQNAQNAQGSQNTQNSQDTQQTDGQGASDAQTQDAQALAAALAFGAQTLPAFMPNLVTENVDAETVQVVLVEAAQGEGLTVNAGQVGAQAQGELLTQQNAATAAQTMSQQAEIMPQAAAGQMEQTVLTNGQQTAMQQTAEQQTQIAAAQPELKTAAGAENAMAGQPGQTEEGGEEAAAAAQTPIFGNGNAVPVKVMEAEQPLEPQADDAAEQLAQKINQALAQGESRITLNLTPANLGSLTVEITRLSDGTLSVILSAVTEKAAGLLDKHSGSLQSLLAGNMPGGNVRVEVENRTPEENAQQFLNPDQQERGGREQNDGQQNRQQSSESAQVDFMQQLRLGLISLED